MIKHLLIAMVIYRWTIHTISNPAQYLTGHQNVTILWNIPVEWQTGQLRKVEFITGGDFKAQHLLINEGQMTVTRNWWSFYCFLLITCLLFMCGRSNKTLLYACLKSAAGVQAQWTRWKLSTVTSLAAEADKGCKGPVRGEGKGGLFQLVQG